MNSNSWAVKVRQRASKGDPIKANANGKPGHTVSPRKTSYLSVFLNRGVLDYYSGIENVAIFNAVIYRSLSLASGMPPWAAVCHVEWKLWAHPGGVARTWHMAPSSSQDRKTKWNPQQEALPELVNSRSLTFKISWNERAKRASKFSSMHFKKSSKISQKLGRSFSEFCECVEFLKTETPATGKPREPRVVMVCVPLCLEDIETFWPHFYPIKSLKWTKKRMKRENGKP